jgi:hydrogenase-4 component E
LVIVLVLDLFALGTNRMLAVIRTVAIQGALLGVMPLLVHARPGLAAFLAALAAIGLKGFLIPWMLRRAMRDVQIKREMEPFIGFLPSMILGAIATGFALILSSQLPLAGEDTTPFLVPAGMATVLIGFILLVTRFKAISQAIGYLVLENGVFIFGMLLVETMPLIVELGILLDLFVAIFVICIIVNHINRAFSSLDTRRMVTLKE